MKIVNLLRVHSADFLAANDIERLICCMYFDRKTDAGAGEFLVRILDVANTYLANLGKRPTYTLSALPAHPLPESGLGHGSTLDYFVEHVESLLVGSSGPRYWGFVTGGSTPASIAGDWLASVYDQNPQGLSGDGDRSALIEQQAVSWLVDLFELPQQYVGGFVSGATMSNFTCLGVARQWLGRQLGSDIARNGMQGNYHVLSATPHSSAIKCLSMLGFGSNNYTRIPVLEGNREAMDIVKLEAAIEALDGQPFILISSGGTVNTVDYDDMKAIAALRARYNFWWHIDAAFGAFAVLSTGHRHLLDGWEGADSITVDCHKWLNVPYDSAVFLVRHEHSIHQVETFQNSNAPYLGDPLQQFNYLNFLPDNSRRLRALPAWFSLMAYGREGYRNIVLQTITLARRLGDFVQQHPDLELLAPVRLNTVCFTLAGDQGQEDVGSFLAKLNQSGVVFMTPTTYQGRKGIRAALVNWRTSDQDVDLVISLLEKLLNERNR